ncbi:MAG: hypothetical protein ABIJ37_02845 [Pseudomonadota bacterium]
MKAFIFEGNPEELAQILEKFSCFKGQVFQFNDENNKTPFFFSIEDPPETGTPPDKNGNTAQPSFGEFEDTSQRTDYNKCGPKKRVTWRFMDGERVTSSVETWDYDQNCRVIKYVIWHFDKYGKTTGSSIEEKKYNKNGEKTVEKNAEYDGEGNLKSGKVRGQRKPWEGNSKMLKRWEYIERVWEKGKSEPIKYQVLMEELYDDEGRVVNRTQKREVKP